MSNPRLVEGSDKCQNNNCLSPLTEKYLETSDKESLEEKSSLKMILWHMLNCKNYTNLEIIFLSFEGNWQFNPSFTLISTLTFIFQSCKWIILIDYIKVCFNMFSLKVQVKNSKLVVIVHHCHFYFITAQNHLPKIFF